MSEATCGTAIPGIAALTPATLVVPDQVLLQHHPRRRVVAGAVFAANPAIDAGLAQARRHLRAQQQMVEPQAGIARPAVALVVPEGEHRRFRMQRADRVAPALVDQLLERRAA